MTAIAGGTMSTYKQQAVWLQVFQVGCMFFSTNSEIISVWKTQQFSLHDWLDKLHLRYGNAVKYWDRIFAFPHIH